MQIEMPPEMLVAELAAVVAATDKANSAKPLFDLVLIEPKAKNIRFLASDGTVSVESNLKLTDDVKITGPRAVCLPARKLLELVKLMSGSTVKIDIHDTGMSTISHGKAKYRLNWLDGRQYPQIDDEFTEAFAVASGDVLRQFIRLTRGFIGEDDSKFAFSGGLLECGDGVIRMVGTDGARIAVAEQQNADFDGLPSLSVLVPGKSLALLAGMVKKGESVRAAFARNRMGGIAKVKFRVGRRFLMSNLTSGKFPAWEQTLPKTQIVTARLERTELLNSLKRSLIVSDFRSRFLEVRFTDEGVAIKTDGNNAGEETLACTYVHGGPDADVRVGVNADYVTQFLSVVPEVLDGSGVLLSYAGENSFIEINPESAECDFRYLIAPVRL